jgi:hypothetical protein
VPEYVVVVYPRVRDVFIGGLRYGQTNKRLVVGAGGKKFSLGIPYDYQPRSVTVAVHGTTPTNPVRITAFEPIA